MNATFGVLQLAKRKDVFANLLCVANEFVKHLPVVHATKCLVSRVFIPNECLNYLMIVSIWLATLTLFFWLQQIQ